MSTTEGTNKRTFLDFYQEMRGFRAINKNGKEVYKYELFASGLDNLIKISKKYKLVYRKEKKYEKKRNS